MTALFSLIHYITHYRSATYPGSTTGSNLHTLSSKFSSGMSSTAHLGLEYSGEMIRPSTEKILAIAEWPTPKSPKEVRSFLGLDNFYHCYIPKFAVIMQYFITG